MKSHDERDPRRVEDAYQTLAMAEAVLLALRAAKAERK
jgi:hypothetical protein